MNHEYDFQPMGRLSTWRARSSKCRIFVRAGLGPREGLYLPWDKRGGDSGEDKETTIGAAERRLGKPVFAADVEKDGGVPAWLLSIDDRMRDPVDLTHAVYQGWVGPPEGGRAYAGAGFIFFLTLEQGGIDGSGARQIFEQDFGGEWLEAAIVVDQPVPPELIQYAESTNPTEGYPYRLRQPL
jgi:hypothetical protein